MRPRRADRPPSAGVDRRARRAAIIRRPARVSPPSADPLVAESVPTSPSPAQPVDATPHAPCPLAVTLAHRLRDARAELTARWLERIVQRVTIAPNRVFPTDELLNHVPLLLAGVADYIEHPGHAVQADSAVIAKAMELGALRHAQGFDAYEVLKEYEILGGILFAYLTTIVDDVPEECTRGELFVCAHRVFHAVTLIQQATTMQFLQRATERLNERDERLRAFNRTLAHEFRNRIGAASGAAQLLGGEFDLAEGERRRMAAVVVRNVDGMKSTLENLLELSRMGQADTRQQRHVLLSRAAAEVARSLRDFAAAHAVELRLGTVPEVEVNAAAVELCLTNLVSNAVKYADPAKPVRWVVIDGALEADTVGAPEVVVRVRDNGLGVPAAQRDGLFRRFFRAHEHSASHVEGTGLGLSIVRETVRALGGRVWAEFPEEGAVFAFAIPARRTDDR